MRFVLVFASLNEAGEDDGAHNLVLAALLAVARTLVGLHLCVAAALHADRRTDAVAYRDLQEPFDIFKPLGIAKLEEPNGLQRQIDTMDGGIFSSSLPGPEPFGCRLARRRNWLNAHQPEPLKQLDGQTISAMIINTRTDLDITTCTNLTIDRVAGRLSVFSWMDNCAGKQQGMPRGMCTVLKGISSNDSGSPIAIGKEKTRSSTLPAALL
jgi:hypothetical protein